MDLYLALCYLIYFYAISFCFPMTFLWQTMRMTTSHIDCTGLEISDVLIKLDNAAETVLQWFKDNRMKANPDKYHVLINNTKKSFQIKIGNETVSNSKYEKLLGVKIDHELNFNEHV